MLAENINAIEQKILEACKRANRSREEVTLIAVSKTKPISMIQEVYDLGIRDFGENKVQEICEKHPQMANDTTWHLIGHLQTNKVKQVIDKVSLIHSVDSLRLAEVIEKEAAKKDMIVNILIEVNVAEEESKFGLKIEEVIPTIEKIATFPHVRILLMVESSFPETERSLRLWTIPICARATSRRNP